MKGALKDFIPQLDFPLGLFVGAVSVATVVMIGNAVTSPHWATIYAAVIGGLFAVAAVWGALFGVALQVKAQAELHDRQRQARLEAERASLPIVLSELTRVCWNRVNHAICRDDKWRALNWELSNVSLETLKSCIEYEVGDTKEYLIDLLAIYQLCRDTHDNTLIMWPDVPNHLRDTNRIDGRRRSRCIVDWESLLAKTLNMLHYARKNEGSPSWEIAKSLCDKLLGTLKDTGYDFGRLGGQPLTSISVFADFLLDERKAGQLGWSGRNWRDRLAKPEELLGM